MWSEVSGRNHAIVGSKFTHRFCKVFVGESPILVSIYFEEYILSRVGEEDVQRPIRRSSKDVGHSGGSCGADSREL